MNIQNHVKSKNAFLFTFDDLLYPQKDYLLQVYYLFSEFLTYSELQNATKILNFMKSEFEQNGSHQIFEKTAKKFNIPLKYNDNFKLLHQTARLPLKLLLYKQVLALLQELVVKQKKIFLVLDGNPAVQLNKIKQTEWHGLESYLTLYFVEEFNSVAACIKNIIQVNELNTSETVFISNKKELNAIEIDYFFATNLF